MITQQKIYMKTISFLSVSFCTTFQIKQKCSIERILLRLLLAWSRWFSYKIPLDINENTIIIWYISINLKYIGYASPKWFSSVIEQKIESCSPYFILQHGQVSWLISLFSCYLKTLSTSLWISAILMFGGEAYGLNSLLFSSISNN